MKRLLIGLILVMLLVPVSCGAPKPFPTLPPGTVRNPSGRDTRSDKKIGTIRKELGKK